MIKAAAPIVWFDVIDSTNEEAVRRARSGQTDGLWIEAGAQTAGRGRRGRAWLSEPGNLFMTYLGATDRGAQELALLGFIAALAVADLADEAIGAPVSCLKWPNDVLIDGAKLSGILLESGALQGGELWFALGIGINVASAPELASYPIASLAQHGATEPAAALRLRLRAALAARAQQWDQQGFQAIRAAWHQRAFGLGQQVRATLGQEAIVGTALGLSPDGALEIETPDGRIRSISAGEVYFTA